MLKKVSKYLFDEPDKIGFDNYLILVLSFLTATIGLLGTIINIVLQLGWVTILSTLIPTVFLAPIYYFSKRRRKYVISKYALTILSLLLLTFQWFINYGSQGPVLYLFVVLESFILIFFVKWERIFFSIAVFFNVTGLFLIEYYYPSIFGKYETDTLRLLDLYFGILIYLFLSILLLNVAIKFYIGEQEKAKLADKLKSAFLANMSHEIRTPMNGIVGFTELLKNPELSGIEQQNYISIIEKSGVRLLNIINNIVDISKIDSGLMGVEIANSNINEQTEYIYTFFKPEVEAKGMKLILSNSLSSDESIINTDREKLFAILTNLVKNAIKYTDSGTIEFGYEKKGSNLEFFIRDTGIGIPKDRQEAIFERFIQADISDKMARQGAGLGLSITKAYVEMLGGRIWVESEEGKGSSFYFTIPYITESPEQKTSPNAELSVVADNYPKGLKILIAEDDETSEKLVTIQVRMISREILKVSNGKDAVESCRNNPDIDLILMDIQMPVMGGYEATRLIRGFNKEVIIIAQTAYGLTGDREKSIEAGCNDYLSKPIIKDELMGLIQKHFRI